MKIRVGVSNRHIHLCRQDADILFGKDYQFKKRNDLYQKGEYACMETVEIKTTKSSFPYVRVMGPLREYTQVEVSQDDAHQLGINPPIRASGDLDNSESLWIIGPLGKIYKKNCCIIAQRHIHYHKNDQIGYTNKDIVTVKVNDQIMDNVHLKSGGNLELHIDKTDAYLYGLNNGDYVDLD